MLNNTFLCEIEYLSLHANVYLTVCWLVIFIHCSSEAKCFTSTCVGLTVRLKFKVWVTVIRLHEHALTLPVFVFFLGVSSHC